MKSKFQCKEFISYLKAIIFQLNLNHFSDCDFTEDAVTKALDKIKVNKTPGFDCIAPRILKKAKYQISKPLAILFNTF